MNKKRLSSDSNTQMLNKILFAELLPKGKKIEPYHKTTKNHASWRRFSSGVSLVAFYARYSLSFKNDISQKYKIFL